MSCSTTKTTNKRTGTVSIESLDKASELAIQIHAMVCVTFGNGGDSFRAMSDDIQDGFMWAMESKIEAMKFLIASMEESRSGEGKS